jgi:hypothetical protein
VVVGHCDVQEEGEVSERSHLSQQQVVVAPCRQYTVVHFDTTAGGVVSRNPEDEQSCSFSGLVVARER